jgi:hypothetical protein
MTDKQTGNISQNDQAETDGPVRYLDPGALARPLDFPRRNWPRVIAIMAIAAVIGVIFFVNATGAGDTSSDEATQEAQQIIAQAGDLKVPVLTDYTINDANGIKSRLDDANIDYYDNSKNSDDDLDLMKIPDGMNSSDVRAVLSGDTSSLIRYLANSWELVGDFDTGVDLRVRYCDMNATTAEAALRDAADTQGYKLKKTFKTSTDSAGNTSVSGKVTYQGITYNWTISACDLSNVYSAKGLPSAAQYVGIHLTD